LKEAIEALNITKFCAFTVLLVIAYSLQYTPSLLVYIRSHNTSTFLSLPSAPHFPIFGVGSSYHLLHLQFSITTRAVSRQIIPIMSTDTDAATEALILKLIAEDAGLPFPDTTSTAPLSPAQDSEDLDQLSADIEDFAIDHNLTYEEAEEEPVPLLTPLPESEESGSAGVAEVFDWGSSGYRDGGSEVEGWEAEEGESDNQAELDLSSQTQAAGGWNAAEASVPGANWSYGRDGMGTDSWERELLQVGSDIP